MKERLTGATILVAVVVLLVPELLTGPIHSKPSPSPQATAATPSAEEPPLRSYTIDLADDSRTHSGAGTNTGATTAPASGADQPAPLPQSTASPSSEPSQPLAPGEEATPAQTASVNAAPPVSDTPGTPPTEIPVPAPAQKPGTSTVEARASGAAKAARGAREEVSGKEESHGKEEGRVKEVLASAPAPAPVRAAKPVASSSEAAPQAAARNGWMVQLGVFASKANADRLAQGLKTQGFHPLVATVAAKNRTLFHVRVGPVTDHAAAEQLSAKLRAAGHTSVSIISK